MIITKFVPYAEILEAGKILNITLTNGSVIVEGFKDSQKVISASPSSSTKLGPYPNDVFFKVSLVSGVADVFESFSFDQVAGISPSGYINPKTGGIYGDKIRAAIQSAFNNNPIEHSPFAPAPTYAASTIYGAGTVVRGTGANAVNLYLCVGSTTNINARGTSGAASPPTGTSNDLIVDGTVAWFYVGKTRAFGTFPLYSTVIPAASTDVMTGFVAFVANSAMATLGLTRSYTNNRTGAGPFSRMGGHIRFDTTQAYIEPFSNWIGTLAGGNYTANRAFMEFQTSAQQWIGLQCIANMNSNYGSDGSGKLDHYDIVVNGRRLSESMIAFNNLGTAGGATPGASASTLLLDLSQFGAGVKTIRITSHGPNWGFQAPNVVLVKDTESVWATTPPNALKLSVEGDSTAQGGYFGQNFGRGLIEHELMDLLGFTNCINTAIGGTSASNISNGGANTTFGQRLQFITESGTPDIHIIMGFHNEVSNTAGANLTNSNAAILQYLKDCRTAFPNALIVVVPTLSLAGDSLATGGSNSLLDLENRVLAQYNAWADTNAMFIPLQVQNFPFFNGTSFLTSSWYHSSGNSAPYNDSHPTSRLYPIIAQYIAAKIRNYYQVN